MISVRHQNWVTRLARSVAHAVVPPVCLACHVRLDQQDALCGKCWSGIAFIRQPLCDRLGVPLPFGQAGTASISAAAAADPPLWNRTRAVAVYDSGGVVAGLIHGMKYADKHDARRMFAHWMAQAGRDLLSDAELMVPVPLSRWRLIQRQFNQAALLTREVSALSGVGWSPSALVKTRETKPQAALSGVARRDNLRGAFAVTKAGHRVIGGRRILLIDDVITTGATAEAATRALLAAGAAQVDVLALARVVSPALVTP